MVPTPCSPLCIVVGTVRVALYKIIPIKFILYTLESATLARLHGYWGPTCTGSELHIHTSYMHALMEYTGSCHAQLGDEAFCHRSFVLVRKVDHIISIIS